MSNKLRTDEIKKTCRYFPSKYNKYIKALNLEMEGLLKEIIESRMACVKMDGHDSDEKDLLGILMNEMQMSKKKDDGFSLNLQVIMDQCKTFFFAGHETTALCITWAIMLLASSPEWQDRLREEVTQACNGAHLSVDHITKLRLVKTNLYSFVPL